MGAVTEKIAGLSLLSVLALLAILSAMRWGLRATRIAALRSVADVTDSAILAIALVFLVLRPFLVQSFYIPSASMHPTLWEGDLILVNKWAYRGGPPKPGDVVVFRAPREAAPDEKEFIKRLVGLPGDTVAVRPGMIKVRTSDGREVDFDHAAIRASLIEPVSVDQALRGNLPPLRLTANAIYIGERKVGREDFALAVGMTGASVTIEPGCVLRNGKVLNECAVAEDPQYYCAPRIVPPGHLYVLGDNRNQSFDSHDWGFLPAERLIGRADWVFWPPNHARRLAP